jgi:hypothetical protein
MELEFLDNLRDSLMSKGVPADGVEKLIHDNSTIVVQGIISQDPSHVQAAASKTATAILFAESSKTHQSQALH